jgi:hypothetical protein
MKKYTREWWTTLRPERVGDETENLVEALFAEWNKRLNFAWHRLPDAKSGKGRIHAQPADYIYRSREHAGFLEVKALKHAYRLPAERVTQLPTLRKWSLAGSRDLVLVFHYMEGLWRIMYATELEFGVPSWDLRGRNGHTTAEEALLSTGLF